MLASFLIMFRESLEASIIVGILLGYLLKTKQEKYNNLVYLSVAEGIAASIAFAFIFNYVAGGFRGITESIFEGATMIIAALLLTFMILWMLRQRNMAHKFHKKMQANINTGKIFGLFMLGFIAILREGVETALFLVAASYEEGPTSIVGAFLGLFAAIILGYLIFAGSMKISLRKFFSVTSLILVFFAAGLVGNGIRDIQETGMLPILGSRAWDLNPLLGQNGAVPLIHQGGIAANILEGLFGYNPSPSILEVVAYLLYLSMIYLIYRKIESGRKSSVTDKSGV